MAYYTLEGHLHGPPGQVIPKRGMRATEAFNTFIGKWDVFGDAVLNSETTFPYNRKVGFAIPTANSSAPMVLEIVTSVYFCVHGNNEITALRAMIDDKH